MSRITRGPPIFLLPLLLVKETAGIISLCLSPVRGSPFRPPSSRRRREEAPTKHLEASFEIKAGTRDLRRRLTSCFAWQCFDPVVIGYRSVTKQSTQQPTARCHGLKRIRARAACTFVHSFRSPHTHTRPAKRERERRGKEESCYGCNHISHNSTLPIFIPIVFQKRLLYNIPTRRDTRLWICNTCSVPLVSSRSSRRSTWRKKHEIGVTSVSDLDASRWTWSKQQGRQADGRIGSRVSTRDCINGASVTRSNKIINLVSPESTCALYYRITIPVGRQFVNASRLLQRRFSSSTVGVLPTDRVFRASGLTNPG